MQIKDHIVWVTDKTKQNTINNTIKHLHVTLDLSSYYPVTKYFIPVVEKIAMPDPKLNFIDFNQCQSSISNLSTFGFLVY